MVSSGLVSVSTDTSSRMSSVETLGHFTTARICCERLLFKLQELHLTLGNIVFILLQLQKTGSHLH